jgi:choline dehydrogenase-like flavoprotein
LGAVDGPGFQAMLEHAFQQAEALYKAVGAERVLRVPPFPAGHNMGVARMHDQAEYGVVNRHGQSHDIANLFVSDGSTFTTGGAANPTLTLVALAIRQAEFITAQMKSGAV